MVGLPQGGTSGKDIFRISFRAAREAEKEDLIRLSRNSRNKTTDGPSKLRTTSFFPLRKLKGSQPFPKKPTVWLAQLDEEDTDDGKDPGSNARWN